MLLYPTIVLSQSGSGEGIPEAVPEYYVIPPSPEVMAINKYVDLPVSYYTGTPSINIPIYTLKTNQLELPVSLSYHASGLKVEENASWAGAGWTLNAGGVISRTVKGLPDEYETDPLKGYFHLSYLLNDLQQLNECSANGVNDPLYYEDAIYTPDSVADGYMDMEPDLFVLSTPSGSMRFVFNKDREIIRYDTSMFEIIHHPYEDLESISPSNQEWVIEDEKGIKYTYDVVERTKVTSQCGKVISMFDPSVSYYESAWYLKKMELGNDWIEFYYSDETLEYEVQVSESAKFLISIEGSGSANSPVVSLCKNETTTQAKLLDSIATSNSFNMKFIKQTRLDISGGKRLSEIKIKYENTLFNDIQFNNNSYFNGNKLRLEGIQWKGDNETNPTEKKYEFEYYDELEVPAVNSNSMDYWGYYNGKVNSSLIPEYRTDTWHLNKTSTADREPVLQKCQAGSLKKIYYPTGGYHEFIYELHDFYNAENKSAIDLEVTASGTEQQPDSQEETFTIDEQSSITFEENSEPEAVDDVREVYQLISGNWQTVTFSNNSGNRKIIGPGTYKLYVYNANGGVSYLKAFYEKNDPKNVNVGGLRLSALISGSEFNNPDSITVNKFDYLDDNGHSTGRLFTPPILGGYTTTTVSGMVTGFVCNVTTTTTYLHLSASSQLPLAVIGGSHIGYSRVRTFKLSYEDYNNNPSGPYLVAEKASGESEYYYVNDEPESPIVFPFVPQEDIEYKNGKLLKEIAYKYDTVVSETQYFYHEFSSSRHASGFNFKRNKSTFCYDCNTGNFSLATYQINTKHYYLDSTSTIIYPNIGIPVIQTAEYEYQQPHLNPTQTTTYNSNGDKIETIQLRDSRGGHVITSKKLVNNVIDKYFEFEYNGNLPLKVTEKIYEDNVFKEDIIRKKYIYDGNNVHEIFTNYQDAGTYSERQAVIWGYNNRFPVAKIINASYQDAVNQIDTIALQSLTGDALLMELDAMRDNLSGVQVYSYTYIPGWGISKMEDPNGQRTYYDYDSYGHLKRLKDNSENIVKEFKYHYQTSGSN